MTTKYVARLNGEIVAKRTTKDRTYTHAVVAIGKEGTWAAHRIYANWCGNLDLAHKQARTYEAAAYDIHILPAE